MKKRCPYCRTIVKCDNTIIDEEKGFGVCCDVCGSFIKLPKQINGNVRLSSSYSGYSRRHYGKKRMRNQTKILMILSIFILPFLISFTIYTYNNNPFGLVEQKTYSIFILRDNQTNIDVSNSVEISILTPKENSIFDDESDIYDLSNFEVIIVKNASDIQIDIREISYLWMQVDPFNKSIYRDYYNLIIGSYNREFELYVYVVV